jgi:hypothetical protein
MSGLQRSEKPARQPELSCMAVWAQPKPAIDARRQRLSGLPLMRGGRA